MKKTRMVVLLFCCLLIGNEQVSAEDASLLFRDRFEGAALDSAWRWDAEKGDTFKMSSGALEIHAAVNSFAHIERPLETDLVTATCRLRSGNGISWCTSLFLYWSPGDWCQIGIIPRKDDCPLVAENV